jgi:hypothetical protein
MDPHLPRDAQAIVAGYLELLESHAAAETYPCSTGVLPHSKETIRSAFRTSAATLARMGQLTPELRDYLEIAYVSLADYVAEEYATLLSEYSRAAEELAADRRLPREKMTTASWQRMAEQSRLAGEVARSISEEAERLRADFRSWTHERAPI